MNPVFTFGTRLAEITKQNESACLGVLCLAIKDAGKDPKQCGYQDYKNVFQNYLPLRLDKMNIPNKDHVVGEMVKFLNQKQSIFTMSS